MSFCHFLICSLLKQPSIFPSFFIFLSFFFSLSLKAFRRSSFGIGDILSYVPCWLFNILLLGINTCKHTYVLILGRMVDVVNLRFVQARATERTTKLKSTFWSTFKRSFGFGNPLCVLVQYVASFLLHSLPGVGQV